EAVRRRHVADPPKRAIVPRRLPPSHVPRRWRPEPNVDPAPATRGQGVSDQHRAARSLRSAGLHVNYRSTRTDIDRMASPGLHPPGLAALLLPVDGAHRRCRCDVEWHHGLVRLTARGVSGIFSHRQTMGEHVPPDLLPGTLDLLILKALAANPQHGYGIAQR